MRPVAAILLAAGEGKRMRSKTPKVLHPLCGKPLAGWALDALACVAQEKPVMVVGQGAEQVRAAFKGKALFALQERQLGTGHAVLSAQEYLAEKTGYVLITAGDMPLLRAKTLQALADAAEGCAASLLTCVQDEPAGYGRVIRGEDGGVLRIVEHRDANERELLIRETNCSVYCFDIPLLLSCLKRLLPDNDQGEYYLTDCVAMLAMAGHKVAAVSAPAEEGMGVNDRAQLAACQRILRRRINEAHMLAGVTMIDPDCTYVDADVTLGQDVVLYPGVTLEAGTIVGSGTVLYPGCHLVSCRVGEDCALYGARAKGVLFTPGATWGQESSR